MLLSLVVTATGTARFATSMGYDVTVGYAVGAVFDIAKGILPVGVMALLARRALGTAALLGVAWICLVVFSCLATHATSTTAISAIERLGTWQMEVRGNTKAELATVEQQLAALSRPGPPRPARAKRWQRSAYQAACGRTARSAAGSRKAPTLRGHARRSCSCAGSWRQPWTTSACRPELRTCAKGLPRRPSWQPLIPCLLRSAPPLAACCPLVGRKVWRCF